MTRYRMTPRRRGDGHGSSTRRRKALGGVAVVLGTVVLSDVSAVGAGEANCVAFFDDVFGADIANHGQHIVGDYVTGVGHDAAWPPDGQVGAAIAGSGALLPGRSGILQHGASPGASFCNGSSSPTSPPGRG